MNIGQIILIVFGFLSSLTGVFFIYKKIGKDESDIQIPIFGKIKTTSSGVIFFIVGAICVYTSAKIDGSDSIARHHLRAEAYFINQHGDSVENITVRLMNSDKSLLLKGPVETTSDGYVIFSIDTTVDSFEGKLQYSRDSTIAGVISIIVRKASERGNIPVPIPVSDKTPVPKTFYTDDADLRNMINDSLKIAFSAVTPTYRINVIYQKPRLKTLDAGYFEATGGTSIVYNVNNDCNNTIDIPRAAFPLTKDFNNDSAGYFEAVKAIQARVFKKNIRAVFSKIKPCLEL